jgi:hypothetical protein
MMKSSVPVTPETLTVLDLGIEALCKRTIIGMTMHGI